MVEQCRLSFNLALPKDRNAGDSGVAELNFWFVRYTTENNLLESLPTVVPFTEERGCSEVYSFVVRWVSTGLRGLIARIMLSVSHIARASH